MKINVNKLMGLLCFVFMSTVFAEGSLTLENKNRSTYEEMVAKNAFSNEKERIKYLETVEFIEENDTGSEYRSCYDSWIGDGYCDSSNNSAECQWDGGDCCASTDTDIGYGDNYNCLDPSASENSVATCDDPNACNYLESGAGLVCTYAGVNEDCSGSCVAGTNLVTVTADATYSSNYSYIGYIVDYGNGVYSDPVVPTSSTPSQDFCLADGSNSILTGSSSGYGWYGGDLTITDDSGSTIFGPFSQPTSGYEFVCTFSGDCTACSSDDSACVEVDVGNSYPGVFLASTFGVNVVCDDSTACNYNLAGDCTYPASATVDCDGNCIDSGACNGNEADAGSCTYPSSDDYNCDGTCGGVNAAVEDCAGICAGTTDPSDWSCNPSNIETGSPAAGATSGLIIDGGDLTGNYSSNSNNSYTITVSEGIIDITVVSVDLESGYDTLWLCDGDEALAWSSWNGYGTWNSPSNCTQIESDDDGTTWSSTGSVASVYFESDGGVQREGFQLAWSNNTNICDDETACNDGAVAACSYPDAGFDCSGNCLSGSKYTIDTSCTYSSGSEASSYYSYVSYFINSSNSNDPITTNGSPVDVCLDDGVNTFYASSSSGSGWYGYCEVSITDADGDVVFGPYQNPSGYEWDCTSSTDCASSACAADDNNCLTVGGNIDGSDSYASTWHSTDFALGDFTCDDTAACNYGEAAACTYPTSTTLDCDGNCIDSSACNGNVADAGSCTYPDSSGNYDCDGTCGGANAAVVDCAGVCAGTAQEGDWACDSSNIAAVNGQTLDGDTGSLKDPGEDSSYGNNENYSVTISNDSSDALVLTFSQFAYEYHSNCNFDYLMINDGGVETKYCGTNTPGVDGVYTASGSSLTLTHKSDGSQWAAGFSLTWEYLPTGCTDSTACNYDADAQVDDGSCTFAATNFDCAGNCLDGLTDDCGVCGGLNASKDCAGTCSGTLAQGQFSLDISYAEGDTQNEIYTLTASGSNWSVEDCSNFDASSGQSLSFSADCNFTSSFWAGPVTLTLSVGDESTGLGTITLSGNGLNVSVDGAVDLDNSTGNTLVGDTNEVTVGGAVADNCNQCDTDPTNDCTQDCSGQWGGDLTVDSCGQCGGLDSNLDCAGLCSGVFADGTWTNVNPGSQDPNNPPYIHGTANDNSWSLSDCYYTSGSGVNVLNEDGSIVDITAVYSTGECLFTSSVYTGQVAITTVSSHNTSDNSLVTAPSFTLDGGALFSFSSSGTYTGFDSIGSLTGDLPGGTLASPNVDGDDLCDDVDNDNDNDGVADDADCAPLDATASSENACGVCVNALSSISCDGFCIGTLSAGTFSLSVGEEDADGNDNAVLSASGDNWSISDCGNWNVAGGDNTVLAFSADCTLTSDVYVGSVTITLDVADEETGTGSVTVTSPIAGTGNFSTTLSGSVNDLTLFPNITGALAAGSSGTSTDFDLDGICDVDDSDADGDGVPASTDGINGDCDDFNTSITACTYASCDDWGQLGCFYPDSGSVATWDSNLGQGWWTCANEWGGQVCGLAQVNFEVDTNGSAEAANLTEMGVSGWYNNWNPRWDRLVDSDGDGVYTATLYFPEDYDSNPYNEILEDPYEIKFFDVNDLVYNGETPSGSEIPENLLDFGLTVIGSNQWGDYYEYLNASCAPATDYDSYANRVFSVTSADINNSITIKACYGSCNETCLTGCTDATSCTFTALDNLDVNNEGQPNYDGDDGSCDYIDTCGFCGGLDANLDCLGECSGTLSAGTLTENLQSDSNGGVALSGMANDSSWSLGDCTVESRTVVDNSFLQTVSSTYDCSLESNVFSGVVSVSTEQNIIANTNTPTTALYNFSMSAGSIFGFSSTNAITSFDDAGIVSDLILTDTFGLVGTGVDGKGTDCNGECAGSAFVDDCGVCAGGGTVFSAGSFTLEPNATDDDWSLTASADDGSWSLGNCSNYDGSGAPDNNLAFTADCVISSVAYSGTAALVLTLSDVADDGSATGSVSLSAPGFSATASGSVADSSTFPTLNGSLSAFGEFPNEDNLGCGCFNDAPLTYFEDADSDGLGSDNSGLYCLLTDDCTGSQVVAGGCQYDPIPTTVTPGSCEDTAYYSNQYTWQTCDTFANYPSWCSDTNDAGTDTNGDGYVDGYDSCCNCVLDGVSGGVSTPDLVTQDWVLNSDDINDNCGSNIYDCSGLCEGPGNNTDTADGSCCASGYVDCNGLCDSDLIGTGVDGKGTDCNNVCGGPAQNLLLSWNTNSSTDFQASFTISDSAGNLHADDTSVSACFLADETYSLSLCDSAGNGWDDSYLTLGDESYYGPYSELGPGECLDTSFSLAGTGGCTGTDALNYDSSLTLDWDDGSCLWDPLVPSNFVVSAEDSPADHPGSIGFRLTWDDVAHAERYYVAFFDNTEVGSACDYYGTPGIISCAGDCWPANWLGDGTCDSYYDLDCEGAGYDGGDCCDYAGAVQDTDPDALCYQTMTNAELCAEANGFYCPNGSESWVTADCITNSNWLCDGYDDCLDGADELSQSEGGDCSDGPVPFDSCSIFSFFGIYSGYYDCNMTCQDAYYFVGLGSWIGDGGCDDGSGWQGIDLDCAEFNYDGGDCVNSVAMSSDEIEHAKGVKAKLDEERKEESSLNMSKVVTEQMLVDFLENPGKGKRNYIELVEAYNYQNMTDISSGFEFNPQDYRLPVGWTTLGFVTDSEVWLGGYNYGDTVEWRVSSVTNSGEGNWTDGVSDTVPVLTTPTALSIVAGPQDPNNLDSYEYINLSWEYPTFDAPPYPGCTGTIVDIGDGYCDANNNNPDCGWDGGDCCASSCDATLDNFDTCTECTDCGTQSASSWSSCYDPDNGGSGLPTCNDDYQFGVVVAECLNYSNTLELYWNTGCTGEVWLDGSFLTNSSDWDPPIILYGLDPDTEHTLTFVVEGEVVATEVETSSSEDCDAPIADCPYSASYIADGWCYAPLNIPECDYDGGDCCPSDCEDDYYSCYWDGGTCGDCADPDSVDLQEGGQCYVAPCYGTEISSTSDNWCNEVSWTVYAASGTVITTGGCNYNQCYDTPLPDGWYVELEDSWGDGWSGCVLTVAGVDFELISGSSACYDSSGASIVCPSDDSAGGGSAYDPECTDGSGSDCAPGTYWDGGSCYTCSYCMYNYDDSDCPADSGEDCCGQCGGSASGCTGTMSGGGAYDGIKQLRDELSSLDENSKEWWKVYSKLNGYQTITDLPDNMGMHHTAYNPIPDSDFDIVTELSIGLATQFNYKSEIEPQSSPEFRAAEGFIIYKFADDGSTTMVGSTTVAPAFQVVNDPVGCYAVSAYDSSPYFETSLSASACIENVACPVIGDVTGDYTINVSDIVFLVNSILGSGLDASCADMNGDGSVNVSDVVGLVNVILSGRVASFDDASEAVLFVSENSLRLESNGFVQGIQMTLSHDSTFELDLADAYVSEFKTIGNQTTLMLVTDGSHSINDIATFSGDIIIESIHAVNQSGDVTVEETVEIAGFEVKVTGPNPFNPSTQLNIVVPEAGFVSVNVYNILGQKVATLVDGYMEASAGHVVNFNASNLASGVYLVRAVTANDVSTQKLMLLK